jgi:glycosyltransferase involved in cell wall biosynthesis
MDILLITSVHPLFDPRIYYKMFCSLKNNGFEVKILLPNQVKLSNEDKEFDSFEGRSGKWSRLFNNFNLIKRTGLLKPKLVIFFDPDLLPFMLIYKLLFRSIVIYDNHEDYPSYIMVKESIPVLMRKIIRFTYNIIFKIAKHGLDKIIYADQFTTGINRKKTNEVIIYNYPIITESLSAEKKYDLIFPGSIDLGVCQRLLRIAEELENFTVRKIKFLIIGRDVSEANRTLIIKCVEKLQNVKIIFIEDISYDSVQKHISESKIGLLPLPDIEKFRRNIPTKMFEYMLHSIPILASDLPPIRYYLKNAEGNYCIEEEKYYCSYAEKILEILSNYPDFLEAAKNNKYLVREQWNWNKTEEPKLIGLIENFG